MIWEFLVTLVTVFFLCFVGYGCGYYGSVLIGAGIRQYVLHRREIRLQQERERVMEQIRKEIDFQLSVDLSDQDYFDGAYKALLDNPPSPLDF